MSDARSKRNPREVAQEKLDVAKRKLAANRKARDGLTADLHEAEAKGEELGKLVAYLSAHPALQDDAADNVVGDDATA